MLASFWLFGGLQQSGEFRNENNYKLKFVYSGNSLLDTVEIGV